MDRLPTLHPVVRVASLIVAATAIALGDGYVLASGLVLLLLLYFALGFRHLVAAWPMIRRLRWFFLSIVVLYGLLGPGGEGQFHVSWAGVSVGLQRVAALAAIAAAVSLLLQTTARDELFKAIYLLAAVLPFGATVRGRLALRITLTLEALDHIRSAWDRRRSAAAGADLKVTLRRRLQQWSAAAGDMLRYAMAEADAAEPRQMTLTEVTRPPLWQWLVPAALVAVFVAV